MSNFDEIDALLADLQSTTANISSNTSSLDRSVSPAYRTTVNTREEGARVSQTPPPLPPPPQDLPDAIPPPQQFGDQQPLYETQNIKGHYRVSGSSVGSQGSGDHSLQGREPAQFQQQQQQQYHQSQQQYQQAHQQQQHQHSQQQRQYQQQSPQHQYQQPHQQQQGMSAISNNLSELDQLLSDLNSAQFLAEVDKKHAQTGKPGPAVAPKPNRGNEGGGGNSTVDSLLDQLEGSVPATSPGPHGGYPVQNNVNYSYQPNQPLRQQQQQQHQHYESGYHYSEVQPQQAQSSAATQELDDLMASLSDFKIKDRQGPQLHMPPPPRSPSPGSEPSYAKPLKSRNLSQSSSANTSLQSSSVTGNMSSTSTQGGQLESMLGDLQSDLNKQGVSTKTKGLCAACNQPVVGQVITALGKIWHIEHFTCENCQEPLGTKNFYERDGVAYCERDYHSLFAPRCSYCNGPIVDKCVTALNKTWHPEHFFCAQCGRPFGDEGFHEKDGKAYCRADFFDMFAPKCGGCGRAIVDNYISALNRHWHPECFACWECHQPFGGASFFDYEGLPYCENHYHAKRGSLCAGCQKPISGRCITAMYKKFHPEHFVCAFCLKQLNKGTFKEQNDRPYCHPCFVKLFG